jgi:hypothetical protein
MLRLQQGLLSVSFYYSRLQTKFKLQSAGNEVF